MNRRLSPGGGPGASGGGAGSRDSSLDSEGMCVEGDTPIDQLHSIRLLFFDYLIDNFFLLLRFWVRLIYLKVELAL